MPTPAKPPSRKARRWNTPCRSLTSSKKMCGVAMDIVWGSPLGLWSLCLLLAYGAALSVRTILAGQSRPVMWGWYAIACLVAEGAGFLFVQLDSQSTPSFVAVGWQLLATILLYPFADRLIDRFEDADVRFR